MYVKVNTNKSGDLIAEVVKTNVRTVLVKLTDGNVIKRKLPIVEATEEEIEQHKAEIARREEEERKRQEEVLRLIAKAAEKEIAEEEAAAKMEEESKEGESEGEE